MHKLAFVSGEISSVPVKPSKSFRNKLGKRIRQLRKDQGLSQAQLAFECGVRREVITRLELGEQNATIDTIYGIATVLEVPIHELLSFD
jgi:transcriptional regulator with XRE-family HTH domain